MHKRIVLAVGLLVSALGGILTEGLFGVPTALTLSALLAWTFALSFGANLALTALLRPPQASWKAFMPTLFCFGPLFLGMMPVSNWMTALRSPDGGLVPPFVLSLPFLLVLWGFVAPGGFFIDGIRRVRAKMR